MCEVEISLPHSRDITSKIMLRYDNSWPNHADNFVFGGECSDAHLIIANHTPNSFCKLCFYLEGYLKVSQTRETIILANLADVEKYCVPVRPHIYKSKLFSCSKKLKKRIVGARGEECVIISVAQ